MMGSAKQDVALIFHGIGTPGRELEQGEAPYWISAQRFAQVLDRIAALPDPGRVRITFDDGNTSDHDIALPLLRDRGMTADVFVLTGRIGRAGSLSAEQINALQATGFGIGSHGIAHRDWRRVDAGLLRDEVTQSREELSEICGAPIMEAAVPFGSYDARVLKALRHAGYVRVWTSDRGRFDPLAFLAPRTSIRADTTDPQLDAMMSGRMPAIARLRRAVGMAQRRFLPMGRLPVQ